ncbi:glycosyltransferase family 4 protein [Paraliobacillus sp. JSM ZJ581]|uniref:glycosyltransferase family 4 protein n=1 Tax=Paraliobacillus sp. JSM ZJ581 TaxID=3342118 RepID=UPI0035A94855
MEKILFVATIDQHIRHFHYPFLKWFKNKGYEVHVASNGEEKLLHVDKKYNLPLERSPFKKNNILAYRQLKKIIKNNNYKLVHCHTPMGGAITRLASLAARRKGLKVIYTAHGFHFFKGAPKKNWLLYYPIEKVLSRFTDTLITINEEDYNLAIKKFKVSKIELVNGVGVDLSRFQPQTNQLKSELRKKLGYKDDDFLVIYVGELSYRKHQDTIIKSINLMKEDIPNLKLILVGEGDYYYRYAKLIESLNLTNTVQLLGYRTDVLELMLISDVAVSSSRQEGLPVNVMEAMAVGLPVIVSNCRGNNDLVKNGLNGFVVNDSPLEFKKHITKLEKNRDLIIDIRSKNLEDINDLSTQKILSIMSNIYTTEMEDIK